jgi:FdhE protein
MFRGCCTEHVACAQASADNRAVARPPYRKRIARAEELALDYPFAAELLGFYARLARFQESIYVRLERAPVVEFSHPLKSDRLSDSSEPFLLMVEEHGPARLADVALRFRSNELQSGWPDLLNATWSEVERLPAEPSPEEPQHFLARAFLQPYAEWIRASLPQPPSNTSAQSCPFCRRKPGAGILRPQGDGALRSLLCSFCLGEWEFRRILCPNCGEQDNKKLPVYTANEFPHIRVECCDACKTYLKTVDLSTSGRADPVVDEIASAPLDLWAQERAYSKLHSNLLGL